MDCVVAVDVGGTSMKGGLVARDGIILHAERRVTPRADGPAAVIAAISAFVADLSHPRPFAAATPLPPGPDFPPPAHLHEPAEHPDTARHQPAPDPASTGRQGADGRGWAAGEGGQAAGGPDGSHRDDAGRAALQHPDPQGSSGRGQTAERPDGTDHRDGSGRGGAVPAGAQGSAGGGLLRPVGVGLAVPGLVTAETAVFAAAFGWRDVPAAAFTSVDLPVRLGHDVRSAGAAELEFGIGPQAREILFLPIGTGIAGAVVAGGEPYGGHAGWAGQIGHIPVYPDGRPCGCGQRGCLGMYASANAIATAAGESSAADVVRRAQAGDPEAARVWEEAVEALAIALATYTLIADPALVVIGGGLSLAGDALLDPLRDRLAARLRWRPAPQLRVSELGMRAGMLGAALLGWQAVRQA